MTKISLDISGMTCASCSAYIQKTLAKDPRILESQVSLATNKAFISFVEDKISTAEIINLIKKSGYGASLPKLSIENKNDPVKKRLKIFSISLFFGLPLFYLSMGGMFSWPLPNITTLENYLWQLAFSLVIIIINWRIYRSGFSKLFKFKPNMDSLIAIGTAAAFLYSVGVLLTTEVAANSHVYFESAGFILIFISLGKYLEEKTTGRAGEAIKKLIGLQPSTAIIWRNNQEEVVEIATVTPGDILIVKPGDKIPLDGEIIFGQSTIDESAITGESIPTFKQVGDLVIGGTINKTSVLRFKVSGVGEETMLAQIIKVMEKAIASKSSIQLLVDKVSYYFVPIVIALALLTLIIWLLLGFDFSLALTAFVSVLIIACPCSLGLATPTAVMMGAGLAAKKGILIKSLAALETANKVDAFVFDKTGTLTKGAPEIVEILTFNFPEEKVLKMAGSLARHSKHPLSEAVAAEALERDILIMEISDLEEKEGRGMKGFCSEHKTKLLLGNKKLLLEEGVSIPLEVEEKFNSLAETGKTPLYVAHGSQVAGLIALIDDIKDSSLEAISDLKKQGRKIYLISGDNERVAEAIADKLGIDNVLANVYPADKAKKIKELQDSGLVVAMVGDGINDAPALAQADLGIAMASGTDIAIEAGEIILMNNDLRSVNSAIKISKFTLKKIKQNLFWAFVYNSLGIPVAAGLLYPIWGVMLSPTIAALAMSLSSVSVVANSLAMKFYRD
ncbi:MAG: heavy metal translocating P-type ATPase [Candidatus Parcubacteria bacterium]|nr:MAG: heavy metal translocating P-type ATPase [Candidatus Parcubacteria bacterium]